MTIKIHALETGKVKVKLTQHARQGDGGIQKVLFGSSFTDWLPIYAFLIEHPEGLILVDSGETARTAEPGYFPWWHPYYRLAVRFKVEPEEEIDARLNALGFDPQDVKIVIQTHMHTDHAGGLHHFPTSEIWMDKGAYDSAQGFAGTLNGYLTHRWPTWLAPKWIEYTDTPVGPFPKSVPVTRAEDVFIVQTPGHTPEHLSVVVRTDDVTIFLAGDTSYTEGYLLDKRPDGVSPDPEAAVRTLEQILELAAQEPTVYAPSHDPEAAARIANRQTIPVTR